MNIDSGELTVERFLGGPYLEIPRFQRPYAWTLEHVGDFWNDTLTQGNTDDYFIGSMVLYEAGENSLAIVDGQQRVTTILLLLCALRDALAALGKEPEAKGLHTLIERPNVRDNLPRYTLRNETAHPYLQDRIFRFGQPELDATTPGPEEKTIEVAFKFFEANIQDKLESVDGDPTVAHTDKTEAKFRALKAIRDRILSLKLLQVELDNEDDAHIIFETLNTRGKDLTTSQLAKNHFSRLLKQGNADVDPVKIKWAHIHDTLAGTEAVSVDSFLHHHWLSKHSYVTKKKLFKEFKQHVHELNAATELNELVTEAPLYNSVMDPRASTWKNEETQLADDLSALVLFGMRQPAPFLLSIMRAYRGGLIKLAMASRAVRVVARFHYTFTAISGKSSSGGRSLMYAALAQKLFGETDPGLAGNIVVNACTKISDRWPTLDEFSAGYMSLRLSEQFKNAKQRRLVRYSLDGIEGHARQMNTRSLTIEHLASQASPGVVDDEHVAMLGNLCLVPGQVNGIELADKSPLEKSPILKGYNVPMLDLFHSNSGNWNNERIEQRTVELAAYAYGHVWSHLP